MKENKISLLGQRICGLGILIVGIIHTAAHFIIPQARQAVMGILRAGIVNTLGNDWASANFSTLMSLVVGFQFIIVGLFIYLAARSDWQVPVSISILLTLLFLFIVAAGPNGGGWLGLPFCFFLLTQSIRARSKRKEKLSS